MLLVETRTVGIDPVVGRFANRKLKATVVALGYETLPPERTRVLMREHGIAYPPTMADLWELLHRAPAERGLFVVVSASGGRYQLEVRLACRDGRGPFRARGGSDAPTLEATLDGLVRDALARADAAPLPAPTPAAAPTSTSASAPAPVAAPVPAPVPTESRTSPEPARTGASAPSGAARSAADRPKPWRVAVQTEGAFGLADDPFYNHLIGVRFDRRFESTLQLGGYAGYASLSGRGQRVASVLTALQLDRRVAIEGTATAIPLRVGLGYLWRNGVVARVASGLAIDLGSDTELVLDLLAPTFWVTRERNLFSLDVAVEIGWNRP